MKINHSLKKVFFTTFLVLFIFSTKANPPTQLLVGIEQSGTLLQEKSNSYTIQLDSNSFISGAVNQLSVDVVIKIFNNSNEEIARFDEPARGLEHFTFNITETDTYHIEVAPFKKETGDYSILINKIEPIASTPEKK